MLSLLLILLLPLTILRPKAGIYCLVFLLPFMPRYLGWGIGEEGFALSPRRIATIACFIGLAAVLMLRSRLADRIFLVIKENKLLVLLLLLLYLAKLAATALNSGISLNLMYVADDLILSLVPAVGLMLVVRTAQDEDRLVFLVVTALLITACLAMIESIKGSVLLQGLVQVSVEEAGRGGLTDLVRSGLYRSKALFDNPLLLSEFVCITWPWAVYLWTNGDSSSRVWVGFSTAIAAPATLLAVHARSGWLVFVLGVTAYVSLVFWGRSGAMGRLAMSALLSMAVAFVGWMAVQVITDPTAYISPGAEGTLSIAERLNQYVLVATAWTESPFLGFGMTRNFSEDLEFLNNIDNYWLRLILEGGALSVVLFAAIALWLLLMTLGEYLSAPTLEYRRFMTAGIVSLLAFALYKLFVSMPTNNAYFYIFAALIVRRKFWRNRMIIDARVACT